MKQKMPELDQDTVTKAGNTALLEKTFILFLFLLLLGGVLLVLKPFFVGLVFGVILAVAAWPVRNWLVRRGASSTFAAMLMLVALLAFVLVPLGSAAPGLAVDVKNLGERAVAWLATSPDLPAWITSLPFVGGKIATQWHGFVSGGDETRNAIAAYARPIRQFFTEAAIGLAGSMFQIIVSLAVATAFWARGTPIAALLRDSLDLLGGKGLASLTDVAGGAIRGVFYGVVGTAAIQGALMALGLFAAGVPAALPLGFVTLMLAISQLGSVLINVVWGGAAWWMYTHSGSGLAFWFIIVWGVFVTFLDNLLKPMLIGVSIDMPITLVILGVFGGFISFGFLGLFIGPALLAVAYAMLGAWRHGRARTVALAE
jgi:predicted PurR-regulated permease PerM